MIRAATLLLATATTIHAACDNQCSGHGSCMIDDVCDCYDNWGVGLSLDSGDCSDRICPFELAWVDTPTIHGSFHNYAECSGKGICDRKTGLCECFDGYEGKACKRTSCPNDCSGHGTCEYIEDLPFGVVWNQYSAVDFKSDAKRFSYYGWDKGKTRGCVCDAQYADVDCSKRMCPHGTDVLDVRENLLLNEKSQIQFIQFFQESVTEESQEQTFALKFTSRLNETFTTVPIRFNYLSDVNSPSLYQPDATDFVNDVRLALLQLPHQVIDACNVVIHQYTSTIFSFSVEFTGDAVQGPQNLLEVIDYKCDIGCTPKVTGLNNLAVSVSSTVSATTKYGTLRNQINETQLSDLNSYECGRRGKCDYDTGLCACFEGYTGENCNTQTTLV